MENRNLEKALDIVTALLMGENVSTSGSNAMLYDQYSRNGEVYDILMQIFAKMDIHL